MNSYSVLTALMAMWMATLGILPVINASPTRAGLDRRDLSSSSSSITSQTFCTITRTAPVGGYEFTPDPWYNPPTLVYGTTVTSTHYVDCKNCDLMVVNPAKPTEYTRTYDGTLTMPTSYSHTFRCQHTHAPWFYPPPLPSSIPDPSTTTTSSITVTTVTKMVTQTVAPSRLRRALEVSSPACTSTVVQYIARPTFVPSPTKTVYARTKTVDQIVDCNWCVLQLETRYAGKSLVVSTVEDVATVYKQLTTSTQTLCSHGEPVRIFDESAGDHPSADRNEDLLDLPQRRAAPPCGHGDCYPDPTHKSRSHPKYSPTHNMKSTPGVPTPTDDGKYLVGLPRKSLEPPPCGQGEDCRMPEPPRGYHSPWRMDKNKRQAEDEAADKSEDEFEDEFEDVSEDKTEDKSKGKGKSKDKSKDKPKDKPKDKLKHKPKGMTEEKCRDNCFKRCRLGSDGRKLSCRWRCKNHCRKCTQGYWHCLWATVWTSP